MALEIIATAKEISSWLESRSPIGSRFGADTQQIAMHPASHHVPSRVQSRLKDRGYVKEVLDGLVLTDDGLQRIAMDK